MKEDPSGHGMKQHRVPRTVWWVSSSELTKEACHRMKLTRGRRSARFSGCMFLRWVSWTRELFLGVLVTLELAALAAHLGRAQSCGPIQLPYFHFLSRHGSL